MRVTGGAPLGIGNADCLQHFDSFYRGLLFCEALVLQQCFLDLKTDPQHRVKGGHGVLKDHGDVVPAYFCHFVLRFFQKVFTFEEDLSFHDPSRVQQKTHYGKRRDAFPASRLPDNAESFPAAYAEVDATYCLYLAEVCEERGMQIPYFKYAFILSHDPTHFLNLGSSASLIPSPSRLNVSIVREIAAAGKSSCCG